MQRLLGTNGLRGVVGQDLTPELVVRFGQATATYFKGSKLLLGRDNRVSSLMLQHAVCSGLLSSGVRPYNVGLTTTPALQYTVKNMRFPGGLMITASHNPPEYNGVKILSSLGVELSRGEELKLEEIFYHGQLRRVAWERVPETQCVRDVIKRYLEAILGEVAVDEIREKGFNTVVDYRNGVTSLAVSPLLQSLQTVSLALNKELDGTFPCGSPEPTREALLPTSQRVVEVGADFGVAYDGDGDRSIFIDDKGRVIPGDYMGAILSMYVAERNGGHRVVTPVSSTSKIASTLKDHGLEVLWTRVGSIDVSYKMLETGALCGFEENGGFFYPNLLPVRDGAMTLALTLDMLAEKGVPLSKLYDEFPPHHQEKTKISLEREKLPQILQALRKRYEDQQLITVDGIKVIDEDWWILVRPSGTEDKLRIFVEAETERKAKKLLKEAVQAIFEASSDDPVKRFD